PVGIITYFKRYDYVLCLHESRDYGEFPSCTFTYTRFSTLNVFRCFHRLHKEPVTDDVMDNPDSLEDWVAIKEQPFLIEEPSKNKLLFNVSWEETSCRLNVLLKEVAPGIRGKVLSSWEGAYTFSELHAIHEQLCLVHPSLTGHLPILPREPRGMWAYISSPDPPSKTICQEVLNYLRLADTFCGQKLLVETLFEDHSYEEYFEKISELRRRTHDESVQNSEDQLANVIFLRDGSINLLDRVETYRLEDEAIFKWNVCTAELYDYLMKPFIDMRELAFNKLREAKAALDDPDLGLNSKEEYASMFTEWQETYVHALDSIQELYLQYYHKTVKVLRDAKQRMLDDQKQFGKISFEALGSERLNRISEDLSLESLQLLHNRKKHFENQRDKIKQQIASLEEKPEGIEQEVKVLERKIYDWQVKILDVQHEILDQEEEQLRVVISRITANMSGNAPQLCWFPACNCTSIGEDEGEFFDAVEDLDDLEDDDESEDADNRNTKETKALMFGQKPPCLHTSAGDDVPRQTPLPPRFLDLSRQILSSDNVDCSQVDKGALMGQFLLFLRHQHSRTFRASLSVSCELSAAINTSRFLVWCDVGRCVSLIVICEMRALSRNAECNSWYASPNAAANREEISRANPNDARRFLPLCACVI
ncbi:hypothetical protein CAPTEDRAFT_208953, partial [Capitella teleta]